MLVSEAITEIRNKINDRDKVGLDDSELLSYFNEAVQYVAAALIANKSPEMVKETTINATTYTLPNEFVQFCGKYPVKRTGNSIKINSTLPITVRYFCSLSPLVTTDTVPFINSALTQVTIKVACLYANAQEHLDVTQDKALQQELAQAIASSMSVG